MMSPRFVCIFILVGKYNRLSISVVPTFLEVPEDAILITAMPICLLAILELLA